MGEVGCYLDLAHEALDTEACSELGTKHLDRYLAAVLQALGEVDRRHPAAAQLALDRVSTLQCHG